MRTALLICHEKDDLALIDWVISKGFASIIVASDNPDVQTAGMSHRKVTRVVPIEQMDSIFQVFRDVLDIRETLNKWLRSNSRGHSDYLYEWIKWCEGGDTTQKIQDAVILIRSYQQLFQLPIEVVILKRRAHYMFEDEVLIETARASGVRVETKEPWPFRFFQLLHIIPWEADFFSRQIELPLPLFLYVFLKRIRLLFKILYGKRYHIRWRKPQIDRPLVLFLLGGSAERYVRNLTGVIKGFSSRGQYLPVVCGWNAWIGVKKLKSMGFTAENVEAWFPMKEFANLLKCYTRFRRLCYSYFEGRRLKNVALFYKNVPLDQVLFPFIKKFVVDNVVNRLVLYAAIRNYLLHQWPSGVFTWGENILDFGLISYEVIHELAANDTLPVPVFLDYPAGITLPNPYLSRERKPDLLMLAGELDKEIYEKDTGDSTGIEIVGYGQNSTLIDFITQTSPEKSLAELRINKLKSYNIFLASPGSMRGYITARENARVAKALAEFTVEVPEVFLLIKPHPSESQLFWKQIISPFSKNHRIKLVDKTLSPYHCLNVCDVFITKWSTLALEAMEFRKPVVLVYLDNEERFLETFKDSVHKFTDENDLVTFLRRITSKREVFEAWSTCRVSIQNEYLPRKMKKSNVPVEEAILDFAIREIENRFTIRYSTSSPAHRE